MRAALLASLVAATSAQAVPAEGVPVEVRRGLFTETDLGGFFTLGGQGGYSNLEPSLQLGLGYQLAVAGGTVLVPLGLQVGVGANARNCWAAPTAGGGCSASENFTLLFFQLGAGVLFPLAERLFLGPRLLVGGTWLDPEPAPGVRLRLTLGAGLGLEYATAMDHFSVGLDVTYRLVLGPRISAIAILPRVQYTF